MTNETRVIGTTLGLGLGAGALVVATTHDRGVGPVLPLVVLTAALILDAVAAYRLQPKEADMAASGTPAIYVVALVLLEPCGLLAVSFIATVVVWLILGSALSKELFNLGSALLSAACALAVLALFGNPADGVNPMILAGAVVGELTAYAISSLALAAVIAAASGSQLSTNLPRRFDIVHASFVVGVGGLAAASTTVHPLVALFGVPPIAFVQLVLNEHFAARRDRERMQGLLDAAREAHASVLPQDVRQALETATSRLLRCGRASIEDREPTDDEWGVPLPFGSTESWLIASDTRLGAPLDADDHKLLAAVAAIGGPALENAQLVDEIRHQATHDALTGLPNHLVFDDRVTQAIEVARRSNHRFAVLVIDIDHFKKVNDSLGHSTGNELLQIMSRRIEDAVEPGDTVARLGGDHFNVLLPRVAGVDTAAVAAQRFLEVIKTPLHLRGHELFMTASIGIAFFPDDGAKSEHLLRNADSAMHRAKQMGRDGYQIYATGMNELAHFRLARESELHNAISRGELRARYQPQIDLRTGRVVAVEALVRWEHPTLGLLGPSEFVPLAEESGLIVEVDSWVLAEACRQAVAWRDAGVGPPRVAVNLSARHFQQAERLVPLVTQVLEETGIDPKMVELEITESVAVEGGDQVVPVLTALRNLGVTLSIDDFGTGYSVLGRLQQFPVDRLKIDRSFVREISSSSEPAPIVSAMIALARSFRLEVVAEGVETLEQQIFLRNHGCDLAQGYLFSQPVESAEVIRMIRTPSLGYNVTAAS